jgi:hypothetical protein
MVDLNFPEFDATLKKVKGKVWIFDVIRKKYVVVTPEEWVRQHLIHYFIDHLNYPRALIKVETGLKYNTLLKRADAIVYSREGKPWLVAECKAYTEKLGENTIRQLSTYNRSLEASYLLITNGINHFSFEVDHEKKTTIQLKDFPNFD